MDGKAFEFVYSHFTKDGDLASEGYDFKMVKEAIIEMFEVQEEPEELIRKAMVFTFDPENLTSSIQAMQSLFSKTKFNERAKFGLLRNSAMKVKELSVFTIYRSPKTYGDRKTVIRDYKSCTKAFR